MTKFLYAYTGGYMAESEEQRNEEMARWGAWFQKLGDAIVDGGNPTGKSVVVSDGASYEGAPSRLAGYTVVEAPSIDEAAEMAEGCPIISHGGSVEVYEAIDMD